MDIGLRLFLPDRPFRLGHLEISFGICLAPLETNSSMLVSLRRESNSLVAGRELRERKPGGTAMAASEFLSIRVPVGSAGTAQQLS